MRYPDLFRLDPQDTHEPVCQALARLQAIENSHLKRAAGLAQFGIGFHCYSITDRVVVAMQFLPIGPEVRTWQLKRAIAAVDNLIIEEEAELAKHELHLYLKLGTLKNEYAYVYYLINAEGLLGCCNLQDPSFQETETVHRGREESVDNEGLLSEEDTFSETSYVYANEDICFSLNVLALQVSRIGMKLARQTLMTEYMV